MTVAIRSPRIIAFLAIFCVFACSGTDNLTDPVVTSDGNTSAATGSSTGGTTSSTGVGGSAFGGKSTGTSSGGTASIGTFTTSTQTTNISATFDWGTTAYDATRGASVTYQNHFNGMSCVNTTCHTHAFSIGGTAYQTDGTTALANAQIGILVNGKLTTTYTGSGGNFFTSIAGGTGWASALVAIRTSTGTVVMPVNVNNNGDCNTCHNSTNRITGS